LHLIDFYSDDVVKDYQTIRGELNQYSELLANKTEVVAITKTEGVEARDLATVVKKITKSAKKGTPVMTISSLAHINLKELISKLLFVIEDKKIPQPQLANAIQYLIEDESVSIPTLRLAEAPKPTDFLIVQEDKNFIISGAKIEGFAKRTSGSNPFALERLWSIMRKNGIRRALNKAGYLPEEHTVTIAGKRITHPNFDDIDSIQQESAIKRKRSSYSGRK
jgi:Domain of unknown function (DUF1967)